MRYPLIFWICLILISGYCLSVSAQEAVQSAKPTTQETRKKTKKEFPDFAKVIENSTSHEGFYKLYQKKENLYCEIQPSQLDQPFLCMITVSRGLGNYNLISGEIWDDWLLAWRRVGNNVHLVRKNVRFRADKGTPTAQAVDYSYSDSVLFSLKIESVHPQRKSLLVNISPVFISDLPPMARYIGGDARFDRTRSVWGKIKAFPKNVELRVKAVYTSTRSIETVPDSRGIPLTLHYSLAKLPENNYRPRLADDRVGHFMTTVKDYSLQTNDAPFTRYVQRWHLKKADKAAKLSPPKEPIIFYIEKTVPHRYRPYIRQGILEWNKAFEKIGFIDAIEARIQQDYEDWDPEDARYNTIRWIAGVTLGYGPSRVNPLTGEILDADILLGDGWLRVWQQDYGTFFDKLAYERDHPMDHTSRFQCQMSSGLAHQMNFMASVLQARGLTDEGGELSEVYIGEAMKLLVMHEVGHTLGLRHNFKASTIFSLEELNNKKDEPLYGSVMEYEGVNIAPEGKKQGHFFSPTIGPWDDWVIAYAYKPINASKPEDELETLGKIASRVATPELTYGTDEDVYAYNYNNLDPLVNLWDLGADPLEFAKQRREIVVKLWDKIANKVVKEGMGYQRIRRAFGTLLYEHGSAMYLASRYIGGQYHHRDHRGDENGRLPFVPVPAAKQREALQFLKEYALSDSAFDFPPDLLNSLAITRWSDWGASSGGATRLDYPVHQDILWNQIFILERLLYPSVLARIQDTELKFPKGEDAFTLPELFSGITDAVWVELDRNVGEKQWSNTDAFISSFRRGLQREHLKQLIKLLLEADSGTPEDARSLARRHLGQINTRIQRVLQNAQGRLDEYSLAHLEESQIRVAKALDAGFQVQKR